MSKKELKELIDKHLDGGTTEKEDQNLLEFFDTYKANGEAWDMKGLGDVENFNQQLYQDIQRKIDANNQNTTAREISWFKQSLKYAAIITILLGFGTVFYFTQTTEGEPQNIAWTSKHTETGKKVTFKLGDGSIIKLNSNSTLEFPETFDPAKREVILTGEAFFDVSKDASRPFTIRTGDIITTVLGTSFNIHAYPESEEIKVSVLTGKVKVQNIANNTSNDDSDVVYLNPGRKATYPKGKDQLIVSSFDQNEEMAWKDGVIYFNQASESDVIQKLTSWYGVEISVENNGLEEWDLTANFDNQSLSEVLKSLGHTAKFEHEIIEKKVTIKYSKIMQ
jgi:transmembrane sensor